MKKRSLLWLLTLLLSGLSTLTGCSSNGVDLVDLSETDLAQYELMGLTRKKAQSDNKGIVVKLFERGGMKMQVVDVTDQFESATIKDD